MVKKLLQSNDKCPECNETSKDCLTCREFLELFFVIDSHNEAIAVAEANRLKIPVIALVDSNSDPSVLSHPIPGNDDSAKSIRIIVDVILDAIQNGASKRVEAPTKRKDITPITQEL